jgi:iron(III) transport system substrate-binding protein
MKFLRVSGPTALLVFCASVGGVFAAQSADWEKVVTDAKKEGQVVAYLQGDMTYVQEFQKAFPEIRILEYGAGGGGAQVGPRVLTERRAGKYNLDLYIGGPGTPFSFFHRARALDPVRPILSLPEVVDETKWFEGRHHYIDPEGQYIFLFEGTAQPYISYHSKLVKPEEITSYWDLFKPRWKGKIASDDPMTPGIVGHGTRFMYYNPELGPNFLTRLFGETGLLIARDRRQRLDWLASGKILLCLFCYGVDEAKLQGLPVDSVGPYSLKEGASIVPITGSLALLNRPPHPNAAKLFINWFLSREGQIAYQKSRLIASGGADSLRLDIPKDDVPVLSRRRIGGKYLNTSRPEWIDVTPIRSLIREAMAKAK